MATRRQTLVTQALAQLVPYAPLEDTLEIRALANREHMRGLPVERAVWLSATTYIRHTHTDYHALLADGYDRDTARFFVVDAMNAVLERWQATLFVSADEDLGD